MMDPVDISILLPTRGRSASLLRCVESLIFPWKGMPKGTELLIGFDEDEGYDPAIQRPGVRAIVMPQFPTLAMKVNHLASVARGRILMNIPNDAVVTRMDWAERLLGAASDTVIAYAFDQANPSTIALPILTRTTVEAVGYYAFPLFPFWFTDTWWDEIGDMGVRKRPVDIGLRLNFDTKGTQGLRDLAFWVDVFDRTQPDRERVARRMTGKSDDAPMFCMVRDRLQHLREDEGLRAHYERNAEDVPDIRYVEAMELAQKYLEGKIDGAQDHRA